MAQKPLPEIGFTGNRSHPFFLGTHRAKFIHLDKPDTGPDGSWAAKATLSVIVSDETKTIIQEALGDGWVGEAITEAIERESKAPTKDKMRKASLPFPKWSDDYIYEGEGEDAVLVQSGKHQLKLSVRWEPVKTKKGLMSLRPKVFDRDGKPLITDEELAIPDGSTLSIFCNPRVTWAASQGTWGIELQPTAVRVDERASGSGGEDNPFGSDDEDTFPTASPDDPINEPGYADDDDTPSF